MREMSLDGITAKVKVKAAAAAKNLVMYVLCPLSMCAAVCSCSGQPDENVTVLTEKQERLRWCLIRSVFCRTRCLWPGHG